jgi:hypothetical protein
MSAGYTGMSTNHKRLQMNFATDLPRGSGSNIGHNLKTRKDKATLYTSGARSEWVFFSRANRGEKINNPETKMPKGIPENFISGIILSFVGYRRKRKHRLWRPNRPGARLTGIIAGAGLYQHKYYQKKNR